MKFRPTKKELNRRLNEARRLFAQDKWAAVDFKTFRKDCFEMCLFTKNEWTEALRNAFKMVTPDNYIGRFPPEKAYNKHIEGRELFAFKYYSKRLYAGIYLKFAICRSILYSEHIIYCIISQN